VKSNLILKNCVRLLYKERGKCSKKKNSRKRNKGIKMRSEIYDVREN